MGCGCVCVVGFECDLMVLYAGKCIPITRGDGIYQEHMNEALERLSEGDWVSQFDLLVLIVVVVVCSVI